MRLLQQRALRCSVLAATFAALAACNAPTHGHPGAASAGDANVAAAEAFVDAFYSFNPDRLRESMKWAAGSQPDIVFYQGWAEGGNYKVLNRTPCEPRDRNTIACSITVDDDLINALGIDFDVTDTFVLTLSDNRIVAVETESDDPEEYEAATSWVRESRKELIEEPCKGYFDGGPTPQDCVRAMARGFAEFASMRGREADR
jgi:hypothetical protein